MKSLEHAFAYFEEVVFIFGDGLEDLVIKLGVVLMELLDRFYLAYDVILA